MAQGSSGFDIQIVSDLHLEQLDRKLTLWKQNLVRPVCEVIAVLGDTCELQHDELWVEFMRYLSENWRIVLVVNGNHEYHNDGILTIQQLVDRQRKLLCENRLENVNLLDNYDFVWTLPSGEKIKIIGSTLWSYIPPKHYDLVQKQIRDYSQTFIDHVSCETDEVHHRLVTPKDTSRMHLEAVQYLYESILAAEKEGTRVIVLTHHAPLTVNTSHPKYEKDRERALNFVFSSEQSGLMKPNVLLWAFGHTHWPTDFMFRHTRVYSNPHGYGKDDPSVAGRYRPDKYCRVVIE